MVLDSQHRQTESVVSIRANLLELTAVAILIGLGVNLLASGIVLQVNWSGRPILLLGIVVTAVGFGYLVVRTAARMKRKFSFEGILPVTGKSHDVVAIDRYEFAEDTSRYIRALSAENRALGKAWADNPLSEFNFEKDGLINRKSSPAVKLAREALEYFVLNELSLHLSAHFENNPRIEDDEIVRFGRRDIPSILLENRFLELFSKPMEEREAFSPSDKGPPPHRVVSATGKRGEIFDQFELILPRGAQVSRTDAQSIRFETKRLSMDIEVEFDGFSANLPHRFEELYLGRKCGDVHSYQINLVISVQFKLKSLLSATGWEYYHWLDSFLDEIDRAFSFSRFLQHIGWNKAVSVATVTRHQTDSVATITELPAKRLHPTAEDD